MEGKHFAVFTCDKQTGNGGGLSVHIERQKWDERQKKYVVYSPACIRDHSRTQLNKDYLLKGGAQTRTKAIEDRIRAAGVTRKIKADAVKAITIICTSDHEKMNEIEKAGRLDEWANDCIEFCKRQFGADNVVSAALHMDESTPHLHITVVPIVTGKPRERKGKEAPKEGRKRYKMKEVTARLCAKEVMTRTAMVRWQDEFAGVMAKYGMSRGIEGASQRRVEPAVYNKQVAEAAAAKAKVQENQAKENVKALRVEADALSEEIEERQDEADEKLVDYWEADKLYEGKIEEVEELDKEAKALKYSMDRRNLTSITINGEEPNLSVYSSNGEYFIKAKWESLESSDSNSVTTTVPEEKYNDWVEGRMSSEDLAKKYMYAQMMNFATDVMRGELTKKENKNSELKRENIELTKSNSELNDSKSSLTADVSSLQNQKSNLANTIGNLSKEIKEAETTAESILKKAYSGCTLPQIDEYPIEGGVFRYLGGWYLQAYVDWKEIPNANILLTSQEESDVRKGLATPGQLAAIHFNKRVWEYIHSQEKKKMEDAANDILGKAYSERYLPKFNGYETTAEVKKNENGKYCVSVKVDDNSISKSSGETEVELSDQESKDYEAGLATSEQLGSIYFANEIQKYCIGKNQEKAESEEVEKRKIAYSKLFLPKFDGYKITAKVCESDQGNICVFPLVDNAFIPFSGTPLSKQELADYNDKLVTSDQLAARYSVSKINNYIAELERKKKYSLYTLPTYDGYPISVEVKKDENGKMHLSIKVNNDALSKDEELSDQETKDYNTGLATADQLAAMHCTNAIINYINDKKKEKAESEEVEKRKKSYANLSLPNFPGYVVTAKVCLSERKNMCVFPLVDGKYIPGESGTILSKQEQDDYNNNLATAKQLAARHSVTCINNYISNLEKEKAKKEIDDLKERNRQTPTKEELDTREKRDKELPTSAELDVRQKRNESIPTKEELDTREQRDKELPTSAELDARKKRNENTPTGEELDAREERNNTLQTNLEKLEEAIKVNKPKAEHRLNYDMQIIGYGVEIYKIKELLTAYKTILDSASSEEKELFEDKISPLLEDTVQDFGEYAGQILQIASNLFLGYIDQATTISNNCGGGGSPGIGWGRDKDEDDWRFKQRCFFTAIKMVKPSKKPQQQEQQTVHRGFHR